MATESPGSGRAATPVRRFSIAIAALGGQGGGVLADWLVAAAESVDWWAQSTSVPGVAQRTGTTIYYVEICARDDGARPVLALMPMPGDVDVMIAAEWMEAGRAIVRGLVTPDRTTLVASTHRIYAISEKSALGDSIADARAVLGAARAEAARLVAFDMERLAADQGTVISAVLLGALAGAGALPLPQAAFERAIRETGIAVESSLRGFAAGLRRAATAAGAIPTDGALATPAAAGSADLSPARTERGRRLEARIVDEIPVAAQPIVVQGVRRLIDYLDYEYADLYLDRLRPIFRRERELGARAGYPLTAAVARYLALWMSYDDAIRVADLKTRAARFARVRDEVGATPAQIVRIAEYLHPRVEEICDTLPAGLGRRMLASRRMRRWLGRLTQRGRTIETSSLSGFALLYAIGRLRRHRGRTLRYETEQRRIDAWLAEISRIAPIDLELAVEIAECQRLVKGYGDTHARGLERFTALMELAGGDAGRGDLAGAIRRLRAAALADEQGRAFAAALQAYRESRAHGA